MKKRLHQYSEEELKRLYSRKDLYELTKILLDYKSDENILKKYLNTSKQTAKMAIKWNEYEIEYIKHNNNSKDEEINIWINNLIETIQTCNNILEWTYIYYGNYKSMDDTEYQIIEIEKEDGSIEMQCNTEKKNIYESIHKNDYNDIRNNKATKEEMYLFIWNTLRFTSKRKLQTLVDTYRSLYNTNKPGVKSSNKMILVYDEKDNLIATYKNRNECIESENISKQNLYKYLKDDKLHKGKRFVESD